MANGKVRLSVPVFGYIDESGTKDDQHVLSVSLVIFSGQFVGRKIRQNILKELYPQQMAQQKKARDRSKVLGLHYCDIRHEDRLAAGKLLQGNNIDCFSACFYHDGNEKTHEEKFAIYTSMVKSCIGDSLEYHEDLEICIAAQGGATGYRDTFFDELKGHIGIVSERLGYRKVKLDLATNAHPCIQIADFYAGAVRDFLRSQILDNPELAAPYELLEKQIRDIKIEPGLAVEKFERMSL